MVLGITFIILILALLAIFIIIATRGVLVAYGPPKPDEELFCGKCGYSATGLPGNRCPECGSDFNVVGLKPRQEPTRWIPVVAILAWVVLSPVAFCTASGFITTLFQVHEVRASASLSNPPSGAYDRMEIEFQKRSYGFSGSRTERVATEAWTIRPRALSSAQVIGDEVAGRITFSHLEDQPVRSGPLTEEALAAWMRGVFRSSNPDLLALEAADIHSQLMELIGTGPPVQPQVLTTAGGGFSRFSSTDDRVSAALLIASIVLWFVGTVFIVRWGRRRQRVSRTGTHERAAR